MSENATFTKPVSLDALLTANKDQFDQLFARQMGEAGVVAATAKPPTREDLASRPLRGRATPRRN